MSRRPLDPAWAGAWMLAACAAPGPDDDSAGTPSPESAYFLGTRGEFEVGGPSRSEYVRLRRTWDPETGLVDEWALQTLDSMEPGIWTASWSEVSDHWARRGEDRWGTWELQGAVEGPAPLWPVQHLDGTCTEGPLAGSSLHRDQRDESGLFLANDEVRDPAGGLRFFIEWRLEPVEERAFDENVAAVGLGGP